MSRLLVKAFDLFDDCDAQWFAWGVHDAALASHRCPPERDELDEGPFELRARSYEAGLKAGEALREAMVS